MKESLIGQVVIITGGAGAIGSTMAKQFSSYGASVVLADINQAAMDVVATEIANAGGIATPIVVDVCNISSVHNMLEKIMSRYGRLDVLINNAGINGDSEHRKPIYEYSDDLWHRIIDVDLNGVYYCSKHTAKIMLSQGKGCIINIASIVGLTPLRLQCAFVAAKAGVINLTKAMALELAEHNIRVNCIAPGSILFEGTKSLFYANETTAEAMLSHIPLGKPGEPDDIAAMACFLASNEAKYMTGSVVTIDGGWTCGFTRNF